MRRRLNLLPTILKIIAEVFISTSSASAPAHDYLDRSLDYLHAGTYGNLVQVMPIFSKQLKSTMPSSPQIAITRKVSDTISKCELTHIQREPIDINKAVYEHQTYERVLQETRNEVISLNPDPVHPDSVFVEDTPWFSMEWRS